MRAARLLSLLLLGCAAPEPDDAPAQRAPSPDAAKRIAQPEDTELVASDAAADDELGYSVSGAGDVDGDGYDDVIAGAPGDDDDGSGAGSAYVFFGSATGAGSEQKLLSSGDPGDAFGWSVSGAGDVDGDGYDDVIVGAYQRDSAGSNAGAAYIFYGAASGVDGSPTGLSASDGAVSDQFGYSVSGAGDLDGDGYDDVIVAAWWDDVAGSNSGSAYVYYGASSGVSGGTEQRISASDGDTSDRFGSAVSGAGDVDGDGYDDVIVGAWWEADRGTYAGSAYIYHGSASGLDASTEAKISASDGAASDQFGVSVSDAGDVDGDGYDDVIVGAYTDDDVASNAGSAYVYYGSATGVDGSVEDKLVASDGAYNAFFGFSVAGIGDLDGDGYGDVIIGAYGDDEITSNAGAAYVFYGTSAGVDADSEDKLTAADGTSNTYLGISVASAGDIDGDGYADAIAGAWQDDDGASSAGSVYTFHGGESDADGDGVGASTDCDDGDAAVGAATTLYPDGDGDGFGDEERGETICPASGYVGDAGVTGGWDCDDADAAVNPAADEVCDGADNDCDGLSDGVDAVDAPIWYEDNDGDGYGHTGLTDTACEQPSGFVGDDSVTGGWDCDDSDAEVYPGALEICDGADNDCDGDTDDADGDLDTSTTETFYADADADGYGDASSTTDACDAPSGYAAEEGDCDDTNASANPGADEYCDGFDNDCDGDTDEATAFDAPDWHADADGDGYGDPLEIQIACDAPSGYVADNTDCDDANPGANPAADEVCDGADNDCDGAADGPDAVDITTWYEDNDGDGYGHTGLTDTACEQPSGFVGDDSVTGGWDCNDADPAIHPAAAEICDDLDNDCDGAFDDADADLDTTTAETWYADTDEDSYGDPDNAALACVVPFGYVGDDSATGGWDCDDADGSIYPGADEYCDGTDEDCDGDTDEGVAVDAPDWHADADGDGYGDPLEVQLACDAPSGYVSDNTDCDDADDAIWPGAPETCGDGVDSDCDGAGGPGDDEDGDGLSWTDEQTHGTDDCAEDTDGDGLTDGDEVDVYDTDPAAADTDGGGRTDGEEALVDGTDPLDASDDTLADAGDTGGEGGGCGEGGAGLLLFPALGLLRRRARYDRSAPPTPEPSCTDSLS